MSNGENRTRFTVIVLKKCKKTVKALPTGLNIEYNDSLSVVQIFTESVNLSLYNYS